jgi:hypothetical protein
LVRNGVPPIDWVVGDALGIQFPAHAGSLRAGGIEFLTRAFHASGVLPLDNEIIAITRCSDFVSGGTGRKAALAVSYRKHGPMLHQELFVKFSRDFDDRMRDRNRLMLQSEVWLAELSGSPAFPVRVPKSYFADFNQDTGTGILITERVAFGSGGIEPFYGKCLDYELPDALEHYTAIVKTLARLAGADKAGLLPNSVETRFPFNLEQAIATDAFRYSGERLQERVERYGAFAREFPQLLPANIASEAFIAQLREEVVFFANHERQIKQLLYSTPEMIALCHWNANIDNAWFWQDPNGALQCGLMDWGRVGRMNVAAALYGSLSGAEPELWADHLDSLLAIFVDESVHCGAPAIDAQQLKLHLHLLTAMMGLAYILDAPSIIRTKIPDLASAQSRFDPRFRADEAARTHLHMITMMLNQWQTQCFGTLLTKNTAGALEPNPSRVANQWRICSSRVL